MGLLTNFARIWLTRSFKPFRFTNKHNSVLTYENAKNLGLYVHIPFCASICAFCPYCKTVFDGELAKRYTNALLREIDMIGSMSSGTKTEVTSLYFGGGSPALIAYDIGRIIAEIKKYFIINDGIGIELHPQDVTEQTLSVLKQAGITKISIGIQSFQSEYLEILERQHTDFEKMFAELSKVPFETVSMDFIFALPGQTIELLKKDIEYAFSHGANHIAVYPFIDFTFTNRRFPKMSETEKKNLLYELVGYCEEKGYKRDSIWTFSKDGKSKYSSMTRENFLGFGCSATTLLKYQFCINTFNAEKYIERIEKQQLPTALSLHFTLRQRMVYYLFWAAYTMRVSRNGFRDFFELPLEGYYGTELWIARKLGWIRKEENDYIMTTKGSYYYHYFEYFYTLSYIDRMWNLMREAAFPEELIIR
ncbi:MAG: radical SAM protein [Clostridiales bacterium]|jgi:oxygen-independent coproporphyrinogen-3 oxidase|nr:radical SAM protein [Clostridiales bacterium]